MLRLQATYVPAEHGIAWWGVPDIPKLMDGAGLPLGRRAMLRLAGVVEGEVRATAVETYVTDLAVAAPALAKLNRARLLDESARAWKEASRVLLRTPHKGGLSEEEALSAIASAVPPAGHAVLNADESAILEPQILLGQFRTALSTIKALREGNVRADLRPYQAHGVTWLRNRAGNGEGSVLADEMGLGKTLQAISVLATRVSTGPHLGRV